MKLEVVGKVSERGELLIRQKDRFQSGLESFKGKEVVVSIERKPTKTTGKQRGYWYGVILPWLKEGYNRIGYKYTLKQVEEKAAAMFLVEEIESNGSIETKIHSFDNDLPQHIFSKAVDGAKMFAAENLETYIPEAKEMIKP